MIKKLMIMVIGVVLDKSINEVRMTLVSLYGPNEDIKACFLSCNSRYDRRNQ